MDNVVAGHNPGTTSLLKQQGPKDVKDTDFLLERRHVFEGQRVG